MSGAGENTFSRLFSGLKKSSAKLTEGFSFFGKKKLDAEALADLEDVLILSDMGAPAAAKIVAGIAEKNFDKDASDATIRAALAEEVERIMRPREKPLDLDGPPTPRIVLVIGVNGSGKTTLIGKLLKTLKAQNKKIIVGAADTFRAAAIEQLRVWTDRAGVPLVERGQGADAAGVAFETAQKAKQDGADIALIDTAGRLQNREELMSELGKIIRSLRKVDEDAPHECLLVLDATVGQNALSQMEAFRTTAPLTGIVMTKLDGTAKGGVLVAIAERHALPIHYIGVGESADDLQTFNARAFSRALVGLE